MSQMTLLVENPGIDGVAGLFRNVEQEDGWEISAKIIVYA
jgi:hypothetical protein